MKKLFLAAIAGLTILAACKEKEEEEEKVTRIEIAEGETINMIIGQSQQLHVNHFPEHLKAPKYKWTTSDVFVASAGYGEVKAKSEGETVVTVTTDDNISASCRVVVSAIAITEIKIDKTDVEVLVGGTLQLTPTVLPNDASYKNNLVYTSTNEEVAKVGRDGKVETISVGDCQIKIASPDGKISTICNIKVIPNEVTNITLNKSDLAIELGETFKFDVVIEPEIATDKTITWVSSDESVATIGTDGNLTSVGVGECIITANSSNSAVKAECKVKINPVSVKGLELSKVYTKILIGSTDALTANVLPADAANKNVIWTSSDETIATVVNGIVTGVAAGTATITATTEDGGFERKCDITVGGIDIFMSAQNGNVVTTFTNFGVFTYVSCEISNSSNADVYVKRIVIDGSSVSVGETLNSGHKMTQTIYTSSAQNVVWIIEYNDVEYEVNSFWNPSFGGFAF